MSATTPLVWYHSQADDSARLVLLAIADHDGEGGAWPSVPTIARMTRKSESTVRRSIKALVALGEITVHLQEGGTARTADHARPNRYEISLSCPVWCDGSARHACRLCAGRGKHRAGCAVLDPDTPLSLVTGGGQGEGVSPVTPPPLSLVTPEPPKEPPTPTPTPPALPESVARHWEGEGISEEHQHELWAMLLADPETNIPARRAVQPAWLVPAHAKIRARDRKTMGAAIEQVRRFGEPCEHDTPGGADLHPVTGLPLCPLCRAAARHG